jgi:FkbM family methyltransferase
MNLNFLSVFGKHANKNLEHKTATERITVLLVCDLNYLSFARVLIYSIYVNNTDLDIRIIVYSNEQVSNPFPRALRKNSNNSIQLLPIPNRSNADLINFYANIRAKHVLELLKTQNSPILLLDVDSLVRNNRILELLKSRTIKIRFRDDPSEKNKVLGGTIYVPNNKASLSFFSNYEKSLRPYHYGPWYGDQIFFNRNYLKDITKVTNLNVDFCDLEHNKNGIIWQAKGGMKDNKNWRHSYTREYEVYRFAAKVTEVFENFFGINFRMRTKELLNLIHLIANVTLFIGRRLKSILIRNQSKYFVILRITKWLPITNPLPVSTLPKRYVKKFPFIIRNLVELLGPKIGLTGATVINSYSINTFLQLRRNYPLGRKGTLIEIPKDLVIFEKIRRFGHWELAESKFLASGLRKACAKSHRSTAFLDIGAHVGLVALQAMNISKTRNDVFLFEPLPGNVIAIKHNFMNLSKKVNIKINQFALYDKNCTAQIYTDSANYGKTSLSKPIFQITNMLQTRVKLVDTREYFDKYLKNYDNYVIKCDAEGSDALICSKIPYTVWKNVESAIIEILAGPNVIETDVDHLLNMWQHFDFISFQSSSNQNINLNQVKEFWLSKSNSTRNLFLGKML